MARYISIALLILLTACQASNTNKSSSLPNIIFILADDMGYGDIRALNPGSKISTPAMDRIAQEGMYFSDAHSPSGVCTPTRYGVLTGRYCFRSRLQSGVLVGHSPSLIEPGKLTVASLLKQSGYATGCIGKWHLGLDFRKKDSDRPLTAGEDWSIESTDNVDYTSEVHGGPCDHGFDYSFILPSSLDIQPYLFISNQQVVEPETEHIEEVREGRGLFWRYGDASKGFDFWQVLPVLTNKATDFIRDHHRENASQPFFLYFPLTAPHTPWVPKEEFKGTSEAGDYGDFVTQVDYTIGQVLSLIDSLNIADNTLIMVSSDNGSHWMPDDINRYDHRANHVYRGMKSDIWEGGHRVPFLVRWPEKVQAGASIDQLVCLTDLMATVAEITGQDLDWNDGEDSYSFLPFITGGEAVTAVRDNLVVQSVSGQYSIRKDNWKLLLCKGSGGWSSPGEPGDPEGSLYNLAEDPGETNNLYLAKPEKVKELTGLLEMYQQERRSRY